MRGISRSRLRWASCHRAQHQLHLFTDIGGHPVAVLRRDRVEVVTDRFGGELRVEISEGLGDEDAGDAAATDTEDLPADRAVFRGEEGDYRRHQPGVELVR